MTDNALIREDGLVWDRWRRHAEETPNREAIVHWRACEQPWRWTWEHLVRTACYIAQELGNRGIKKGDVCALIFRHHPMFYPVYLAVSSLGALPAVLAYPNPRLHPDKFREGLTGMSQRSGLDYILTERELEGTIRPLVSGPSATIRNLLYPLEYLDERKIGATSIGAHAPAKTDEPALVQHSSGTTGLQKPVVLSHRAILRHAVRYAKAVNLTSEDKIVSWLPYYHDMGLIAAFYLPLLFGIPLVQLDPFEWVAAPALLWQAASCERATLAWLPNFAYNFMADRVREEDMTDVRLDSIRMLVNCSEPVRAASHDKLYERFASHGLRQEVFSSCYAMAETTFAITQTPPGEKARVLCVSREHLAQDKVTILDGTQQGRRCVSSGKPIEGCQVRVVDESRREVENLCVGELAITSVSLFDGYRNYPEKTAAVLEAGWYYSGDYGFLHEGECYVLGRKKDLVIVAGNNIYPEDVEDAIGHVEGVIPGRVVAFGFEDESIGTEVLCVVAETQLADDSEKRKLRMAILKAGMAMDLTISRVYLVPARWLIKSSAGKPSRSANRDRALELPRA